MKRKKISETIDNINPKYIDEATEYIPKANMLNGLGNIKPMLKNTTVSFLMDVFIQSNR